MIDPTPLWDFDDPEGSEQRFRAEAELADPEDRLVLTTQVARALGLQEKYDEGHAVLDDLSPTEDEVAIRIALERGRLFRSAGDPDQARPLFEAAVQSASAGGFDTLQVDALHSWPWRRNRRNSSPSGSVRWPSPGPRPTSAPATGTPRCSTTSA